MIARVILIKYFKNNPFILPAVIWLLVNGYSYYLKGIWVNGEAQRYISQSEFFLQTKTFSDNSYILYSLPILLLNLSKTIFGNFYFFVLVQYALSFIALYYLFKLLKEISTLKVAVILTAMYAMCLQINEYNSFIYTDSLFISISFLCLYNIFKFFLTQQYKYLYFHLLFCLLLLFTRPFSLPLVAGFFVVLFFYFTNKTKLYIKLSLMLFLLLAGVFILNKAMVIGNLFDFLLPFKEGRIICGIPTSSPDDLVFNTNKNPFLSLFIFIFQNPIYFLKSTCLKTIAFFGMDRGHYSFYHNVLNKLYFYPIFILGFSGLYKLIKIDRFKGSILLVPILFIYISILLNCDDWGNRFILPLISFFIIGMAYKIQKWLT